MAKPQFYIPAGTHLTLDGIGRVTLMFQRQDDAEEFFEFIEKVTSGGQKDARGTMDRIQ